MQDGIIKFLRKKDYTFIKELGQGACGKTVLLFDDTIGEHLVCKKYSPRDENERENLFLNFKKEIKHLHSILHPNIVRLFNYYLYPETYSGYILMEYIDGCDIENYIKYNPEKINETFIQLINGFQHLESKNILHRDIRPLNILVSSEGQIKIIDLGFSKKATTPYDFDKSISLNWWCEPPDEFSSDIYDFKTEMYFIGKLVDKLIKDNSIVHFKYNALLESMCSKSQEDRASSFFEISNNITSNVFYEIEFSKTEVDTYRSFSDSLYNTISEIEESAKFEYDIDRVQAKIEDIYRGFMLETQVPDAGTVVNCFVNGSYRYYKNRLAVSPIKNFLHLLKSSSAEKRKIIFANIFTKLDAKKRYATNSFDDVPF